MSNTNDADMAAFEEGYQEHISDLVTALQQLKDAAGRYAVFRGGCPHHPDECTHETEECRVVRDMNKAFEAASRAIRVGVAVLNNGPTMQPLECVRCGSSTGQLHPLNAEHPGWVCQVCVDLLKGKP